MEEARCLLSFSTLTEPSGRCKLLLTDRGSLIMEGCFTTGEAEAKRGAIARIVISEKCMLARGVEEPVTVELLVRNEGSVLTAKRWDECGSFATVEETLYERDS